MQPKILIIGAVVLGAISTAGLIKCQSFSNSKMYRAFLEQEKHDPDHSEIYDQAYLVGGADNLKKIRFQNISKDAKHIDLENVTSVVITKTMDRKSYVISLTDVDGKTSSLWLDGGDKEAQTRSLFVGSITPY